MFWWTHGIFISSILITIILKVIRDISYDVNNTFIDGIANFADNLFDSMLFIAADIALGVLSPFVYYYIITLMKNTYELNICSI